MNDYKIIEHKLPAACLLACRLATSSQIQWASRNCQQCTKDRIVQNTMHLNSWTERERHREREREREREGEREGAASAGLLLLVPGDGLWSLGSLE